MKNLSQTRLAFHEMEALSLHQLYSTKGGCNVKTLEIKINLWGHDDYGNRVDKVNASISYSYTNEVDFKQLRQFLRDNPPF